MTIDRDDSGLVCAYMLDGKGGGEQLSWQTVAQWQPGQGTLWLHLDYACEDSQRWLAQDSGLEPEIREALLEPDPRPRALLVGDGLLLIIRGVNLNEGAEPEDMVSLRMWIERDRIVSMRHRRFNAIKAVRERIARGMVPTGPGVFLVALTRRILDQIGRVTDHIEDRVAEFEDQVVLAQDTALRHGIADVRRQAIALRRYIAPERDVLSQLQSMRAPWLSKSNRNALRESASRLTRIIEDLDAARDRAAVTQEELASQLSELTNQRLYTLSIIAAVFLPLGFLTGLLGINVGGIPGDDSQWGFALVCVGMLALGVGQIWLFRRLKWF